MVRCTGTIIGNSIALSEPIDLAEGQQVEIVVVARSVASGQAVPSGCVNEFSQSWTSEDDTILQQIADERQSTRFRDRGFWGRTLGRVM